MLFFLGITVVAVTSTRGPSFVASVLSVVAYDFVFVAPAYTLAVEDARYFLTFAMMLGIGLIISNLTVRLREEEQASAEAGAKIYVDKCSACHTVGGGDLAGPDLVEGGISVIGSLVPGHAVQIADTVSNQGAGASGSSLVRYYLSTTSSKWNGWLLTGSRYVTSVAPGANNAGSASATLPSNVPVGAYNLFVCADDTLQVPETNEANNCAAIPVQVTSQ